LVLVVRDAHTVDKRNNTEGRSHFRRPVRSAIVFTMIDLNDILLFTKLVESKTLTSAAEALGLPKSTVSRRLSLLESQLSVKLFERNTRQFTLTDVGMAYYSRCSDIVTAITSANQYVTDLQVAPRGRIRMTAPTDMSSRYLGAMLAQFSRMHPEINIELTVTDRLLNLVDDGYDLAIRVHGATPSSRLISIPTCKMEAILCASPAYLAERGTPTTIEEFYDHELVLFVPEGLHSFTLTDGSTTHELAPPARIQADHFAPIRDAVIAGAGIGHLCDFSVARELASGELVRVLPQWAHEPTDICVTYPARASVPPRLLLLIDFLVAELRSPPWKREAPESAKTPAIEEMKRRGKRTSITSSDVDVEDRGHRRAVSR
jgi:DNA-binding transcriptional LysR family regulator